MHGYANMTSVNQLLRIGLHGGGSSQVRAGLFLSGSADHARAALARTLRWKPGTVRGSPPGKFSKSGTWVPSRSADICPGTGRPRPGREAAAPRPGPGRSGASWQTELAETASAREARREQWALAALVPPWRQLTAKPEPAPQTARAILMGRGRAWGAERRLPHELGPGQGPT